MTYVRWIPSFSPTQLHDSKIISYLKSSFNQGMLRALAPLKIHGFYLSLPLVASLPSQKLQQITHYKQLHDEIYYKEVFQTIKDVQYLFQISSRKNI